MAKLTYFIAYKVDIGIKNITLKLLIIRPLYSKGKKNRWTFWNYASILSEGIEIIFQSGGTSFPYKGFCHSLALFVISFFTQIAQYHNISWLHL